MAKNNVPILPVSEEFRAQFKNRYFVCYLEWREILQELNNDQYRAVMDAAYEYTATGNIPPLTGLSKIVFLSIKKDMDRDFEHAVQRGWKAHCAELSRTHADNRNAHDITHADAHRQTRTDAPVPAINTSTHNTITHNSSTLNTKQKQINSSSRVTAREDDDVTTEFDSIFLDITNDPNALYDFHHSGYALNQDGVAVWLSDVFFNREKGIEEVKAIVEQKQADNLRSRRLAKYPTVTNDKVNEKILTLYCQDHGYQIDIEKILPRLQSINTHWSRYVDACAKNAREEDREDDIDF